MSAGAAQNIQGTLRLDGYLTNFSVSFVQDSKNFIAQRAASVIPVEMQTDAYAAYDRGFFWRDESTPRPMGGRPNQVSYKVDPQYYRATEYALEHVIDDRQRKNVRDPIQLEEAATQLLTQKQLIKQDRVFAQKFMQENVWTTEFEGVASDPGADQFVQFNDPLSDPIGTIDAVKDRIHEQTGFMPNVMVLGADVKRYLRSHPDIADRIKYTRTGIADEDILAALFEVEDVVTARSIYNAAAEGATNDFNYIAPRDAILLAYIDKNPALNTPTAIANFAWSGLFDGAANAIGGVMLRGRDDRASSDYFQNRMAWDLQQVSADLGGFLHGVVALPE